MRVIWAAILAVGLMACASADAQQQAGATPAPAAAPCSTPEFRQLDFWLGTWDARWDEGGGIPAGTGTNIITRAYGDCVIQEAFDGGPATGGLIGHSVSTYHAPVSKWRQTWVDNQGGYFALDGGPEGSDFILISRNLADNTPRSRMVFTDITRGSFTWRWQSSADLGATWTDSWVIYYTRRPGT